MVLLGALHEAGEARDGNIDTANELYRCAARKGNAQAMWRLGVNHLSSKEGVTDHEQAIFWIKRATESGDAMAAWALGKMYLAGHPLEKDVPAGMLLLQQSATAGYAPACLALAEIYQQGREGVEADSEAAATWLVRSRPIMQRLLMRLGLARIENGS